MTLIACFCLLAAVYLCSVSAMQLFTPKAIHAIRRAPNVRALRLASPYMTVLVGIGWAVVAWGLLQLRNWARVIAASMLILGVFWELSAPLQIAMSTTRSLPTWRLALIVLDAAIRLIAGFYLWVFNEPFMSPVSDESSVPVQ